MVKRRSVQTGSSAPEPHQSGSAQGAVKSTSVPGAGGPKAVDGDATNCWMLERFAATRDPALRDALIARYERLVHWAVKRQGNEIAETDDLLQIGRIALFEAIERFQPCRGVRFITYATKVISVAINRYRRDQTAFVRVPPSVQSLAALVPRLEESITYRLGRCATVPELAEAAGVSEQQMALALRVSSTRRPHSLEQLSEDRSFQNTLSYTDERIDRAIDYCSLYSAIERLAPQRRFIVRRRHLDQWSQQQIATCLGLTQIQVSRLERESLRQLREQVSWSD